ncbi:STAS domain-containing protein [Streptomyces spectabilis]|uniref:STAS domain-containing protein n=1 Tax=Streptomyces spectabilis TaxID=68270 RepID=A0A516RHY7_STRST|nr:STAS domain-containing protein [Streptomyces spectabilis]QDQ15255.1 STAS domain-containing protein [Streptomyces spectabilis]
MHDDSLPFGFRSHVRRERLVVTFWGELDIYATERLTGRLAELTLTCRHDVILDLSDVTFLDCGGLSLLCQARAATRRRELRLTVVLEDPFHRKVLRLAGVADSFDVALRLSDALAVPPGDPHGHRPPAPSHA